MVSTVTRDTTTFDAAGTDAAGTDGRHVLVPVVDQRGGPPPLLTATVVEDVLQLATKDGQVAVQMSLSPWVPMHAPVDDSTAGTIARICALDSALARRLFRRVSAWRPDERGNLSARVRPTA